jgi:hypothetical protein
MIGKHFTLPLQLLEAPDAYEWRNEFLEDGSLGHDDLAKEKLEDEAPRCVPVKVEGWNSLSYVSGAARPSRSSRL